LAIEGESEMVVRTKRGRRALAVLAVTVAASGLAACASLNPSAGISCAWGIKADRETLNAAYPDAGATYFTTRYTLLSGQSLVLSGTYPYARYMSLITYNFSGNVVDKLSDVQINPDPGSDNPFTDVAASTNPANRRWTVTISPDAAPGSGQTTNGLAATSLGSVILRVYVPDNPIDLAGSVPLPDMTVRHPDSSLTPLPTCATQSSDSSIIDLINSFGPATDIPPTDPPVFRRPASVAGLYANPDNTYLASIVNHQPGKVIVVRGKAPSTPDTRAGQSAATPSQLRYWSMCTNEYRKPYPVSFCAFDSEATLDGSGYYTFVMSTPADKPTNATTADGVTWLDWGSTTTNMVMILRHMLPAPTFVETASNVAPGQLASDVMGVYTPAAKTCSTTTFQNDGPAACGP